jgi:hypothetical protein
MKPVIFFSHSSRDRDVILPIRNRLLAGTGNAIKIFMSSDGSSIPFGRNWLKEIEDALKDCKLMFVWMTPSSANSSWIPFEAGHAYARDIHVVPIGFLGTTLGTLPAPISILQGFDVTAAGGLNNIIGKINDQFGLTFPNLFDNAFYDANINRNSPENDPDILRYIKSIDCNFSMVSHDGGHHTVCSSWLHVLKTIFEEEQISFREENQEFFGLGFRVKAFVGSDEVIRLESCIDPLTLNLTRRVWTKAIKRLYDCDLPYAIIVPQITDDFELPDDHALVGSRLINSEASFDTGQPYSVYRFRNIDFRIDAYTNYRNEIIKQLTLLIPRDNELPIPLYSLMRLLEERRIITAV